MNSALKLEALLDTKSEITHSNKCGEPCVCIVIVNYCCLDDSVRCLKSLEHLTYSNYFTIVVDSASPDNSGQALRFRPEAKSATVVLNPENNGFAYSSNVGIKLAMARGADYVWLLNPDTTVDADSLSELVEASIREPKVMAFGSKILYGQGTQPKESSSEDVIWSAGASINFSSKEIKMIGAHEVDRGQYDASHECDYLPGCSLLFKTELVEKVGLLPQDYFMYFEETHWCTKIKNHGGGLMYVPGSKVWHFAPDDKLQKPFTVYYYNRNELKYWYENVSLRGKLKILLDVVFRRLPRNLRAWYLAKTKEQKLLFYAHLSSSIDFLFGRFGRRVFLNR